jgi:hypothetical protein
MSEPVGMNLREQQNYQPPFFGGLPQLTADTQARFPIPMARQVITNRQLLEFSKNRLLSDDLLEKVAQARRDLD